MLRCGVRAVVLAAVSFAAFSGGAPRTLAQALAREGGGPHFEVLSARSPVIVEADLSGFSGTPPGGTWRMPAPGGFYCDGLALEGVAFTRNAEIGVDSIVRTFDVVVDLRARPKDEDLATDLEFTVIAGDRELPLGQLQNVTVRAGEKTSVSETFSLNAYDLDSFFAAGQSPKLRVTRATRAL